VKSLKRKQNHPQCPPDQASVEEHKTLRVGPKAGENIYIEEQGYGLLGASPSVSNSPKLQLGQKATTIE
jgi:hypothetical protein